MTLKMTSAQVVETSVNVNNNNNSSFQNYTNPDDRTFVVHEIRIEHQVEDIRWIFEDGINQTINLKKMALMEYGRI